MNACTDEIGALAVDDSMSRSQTRPICRPSLMTSRRSPIAISSTRLPPPRSRGTGGHRPASLPRPAAPRGRRHVADPSGTAKSRLYRGLRGMRAALDADVRPGVRSERASRMIANDPFERLVSDWPTRTPSIGCRITSIRCSSPAAHDSGRPYRASKGGSPWKRPSQGGWRPRCGQRSRSSSSSCCW